MSRTHAPVGSHRLRLRRGFAPGRPLAAALLWLVSAWPLGCAAERGLGGDLEADRRPTPGFRFTEVASSSGLDFVHRNGAVGDFYYPELMQGGAAFLDYDNDAFLDVYLVQAGPFGGGSDANANRLYRNVGDGTFVDVTAAAGVGDRGYGSGVAVADYDGDGYVDLYVTNLGANTLYRNDGRGGFTDVTAIAGVGDPGYSTSALFIDYDADGDLDLYVCNYVVWSPRLEHACLAPGGERGYCGPLEYEPQLDTLYRNEGGGRFRDVSREAGIHAAAGNGLGAVSADLNGDGLVDLYVANDQMANHLWLNNGDGTFREDALTTGAAFNDAGLPEAGMGVVVVDWEEDGDWDLFLTHLSGETNTFYRNQRGSFLDVTDRLRLGAVSQPYTGFGTGLADFNLDGRLDLFIANGKVSPDDAASSDYAEPNQLLAGTGAGDFIDVSTAAGSGLELLTVSRAAAFGDYDQDGDVDILVANNNGPAQLLRNDSETSGRWVGVELRRAGSDRDLVGATVTLFTGGEAYRRLVQPGHGYCASHDPRSHFGLERLISPERLQVRWPDGRMSEYRGVPADRYQRVVGRPAGVSAADSWR